MSEEKIENEPQRKDDPVVAALLTTVNMALASSGSRVDANDRKVLIGVNLIASVMDGSSENAKKQTLNAVINTLVQASGLNLGEENPPTDAPLEKVEAEPVD